MPSNYTIEAGGGPDDLTTTFATPLLPRQPLGPQLGPEIVPTAIWILTGCDVFAGLKSLWCEAEVLVVRFAEMLVVRRSCGPELEKKPS